MITARLSPVSSPADRFREAVRTRLRATRPKPRPSPAATRARVARLCGDALVYAAEHPELVRVVVNVIRG